MYDATNYEYNLGRPLAEQRFLLSVSYDELRAIKALAQNMHPAYEQSPEMREVQPELFEGARDILERAQRHMSRNPLNDLPFED